VENMSGVLPFRESIFILALDTQSKCTVPCGNYMLRYFKSIDGHVTGVSMKSCVSTYVYRLSQEVIGL